MNEQESHNSLFTKLTVKDYIKITNQSTLLFIRHIYREQAIAANGSSIYLRRWRIAKDFPREIRESVSKLKLIVTKGYVWSWREQFIFKEGWKRLRSKKETIGIRELKVNSVFQKDFGALNLYSKAFLKYTINAYWIHLYPTKGYH